MQPAEILRGVTVAECSSSLAIRYGAKLLQALGATVYGSDKLLGLRQDDAFQSWLYDGKSAYDGRRVSIALVEDASIQCDADNRILVEPFGEGPYDAYEYDEVVPLALSGWLSIAGQRERAPLLHTLPLASLSAGANAAAAALLAALGRRLGHGTGSASISILDTMHRMLGPWPYYFPWTGFIPGRLAFNGSRAGFLLRCEDGYVASMVVRPDWDILAALTGADDLREDKWKDAAYAVENRQRLWSILQDSLGDRPKKQLVDEATSLGFPWGEVQEPEEIRQCPQLTARGFWSEEAKRTPGMPFKVIQHIETDRVSSPASTELPLGNGPLRGIVVVELSVAWAGPFIGRILADAGATVIKVESGRKPDTARALPLIENRPGDRWWERCIAYSTANGRKHHVGLELDREGGVDLLLKLLKRADVLINNHSHRVLRNLGLSFETLAEANPNIVYLTSSGFGLGGPFQDRTSLGWTIEAMCGISSSYGYEAGQPHWSKMPFPDVFGALHGAIAVAAGLYATREQPGALWLDLSQYESGVHAALPVILQPSQGERLEPTTTSNGHRIRSVFECKGTDAWVAVAASSDEHWSRLCEVVDRLDLQILSTTGDPPTPAARAELAKATADWVSTLSKKEAEERLQAVGIPAAAVLNSRDAFFDPHHRQRNYICDVSDEVGRMPWPGPWQIHGASEPGVGHAPSMFGQDNQLLSDWLGLAADEVSRLGESGALVDMPSYASGPVPTTLDAQRLVQMGEFESHDPSFLKAVADFCESDAG